MKILVDMNLSPEWIAVFKRVGWEAVHWSTIGDLQAKDSTIMEWARSNDYVVFTHDLDFGAILAVTHAEGPSVIQIRTQDVTPDHLEELVMKVLRQYQLLFKQGVLIVVDEAKSRVRILPLNH
jgi:predicted nuclease of predicted toxin-antitoxin system